MNKYTVFFDCECPNNKKTIKYKLVIKTNEIIMVEDLMNHLLKECSEGFHENIADDLFCSFGGEQYMIANHHGVQIETFRK